MFESVKPKPAFLGWLGNWEYARNTPSEWGKGVSIIAQRDRINRNGI